MKLLAIWKFRVNASFLFCHRALEDSVQCTQKEQETSLWNDLRYREMKGEEKKSLFSIPLLLWGIKLLVSDLKNIIFIFFFYQITTSSFLLLMRFHLSKQCWERIRWERVRLRLWELEQPQLFLPVPQTVKVEARVHLTRGTACPPLYREGTKLQGISSSSSSQLYACSLGLTWLVCSDVLIFFIRI